MAEQKQGSLFSEEEREQVLRAYAIKDEIYHLCNKKQYFTGGSARAYERMFAAAEKTNDPHLVAYMIWMCSPDAESVVDIENELIPIFKG